MWTGLYCHGCLVWWKHFVMILLYSHSVLNVAYHHLTSICGVDFLEFVSLLQHFFSIFCLIIIDNKKQKKHNYKNPRTLKQMVWTFLPCCCGNWITKQWPGVKLSITVWKPQQDDPSKQLVQTSSQISQPKMFKQAKLLQIRKFAALQKVVFINHKKNSHHGNQWAVPHYMFYTVWL